MSAWLFMTKEKKYALLLWAGKQRGMISLVHESTDRNIDEEQPPTMFIMSMPTKKSKPGTF